MNRHIRAQLLARFQDGAVSDRQAARVRAHLAGCPGCAATLADLGQVTSLLASAGRPVIPAEFASRLDAALAAAVAERLPGSVQRTQPAQPSQAGQPDQPSQPAHPDQPSQPGRPTLIPGRPELPERGGPPSPRQRRQLGRWSSPPLLRGLAAAGVVLVLAGGGLTVARLAVHPSTLHSTAGPRAAAPNSSPMARPGGGAPGSAKAASGAQGNLPQPSYGLPAPSSAALAAWSMSYARHGISTQITVLGSGTDLTEATLASQISAELQFATARNKQAPPFAPLEHAAPAKLGGWSAGTLRACVATIAGNADVKLVDLARYQGSRAAVIVTSAAPTTAVLLVTVVGSACSAANSAVLASTTIAAQG